jgi:hypothetical protein
LDETYQTYLNRVARLTLPATHKSQLQHIQESPKFKLLPDGSRQAVPFPGYSLVTPPWEEEPENSAFYTPLHELQQQLLQQVDSGLIVMVPPKSFHLTLADLIWDSAYRHIESENPEFDQQLQVCIRESFQQYQQTLSNEKPIGWQPVGLMIRPRAIAMCLAPEDENSYKRMLQFRRSIYQNSRLIALGIEQQYHFTAHITLGYFGNISPQLEREHFAETLSNLSLQALGENEKSVPLYIRRAELRKFDDMIRYYREPNWPVLEF